MESAIAGPTSIRRLTITHAVDDFADLAMGEWVLFSLTVAEGSTEDGRAGDAAEGEHRDDRSGGEQAWAQASAPHEASEHGSAFLQVFTPCRGMARGQRRCAAIADHGPRGRR